jgi:hypothetical protein
MAVVAIEYGSRAALVARITEQRLVQMFDDDGDGVVAGTDLVTLNDIMGAASDVVTGLLLYKGFNAVQLETIKLDRQVIHAWAGIAAQLAGERKTEWLNDQGEGPYDALGARGRAELKALSIGMIRSVQEADAGPNAMVGGEVSVSDPVFIFNRNPRDPNDRYGPGGF